MCLAPDGQRDILFKWVPDCEVRFTVYVSPDKALFLGRLVHMRRELS